MACGGHTNSCPAHPGYDPPLSPVSWPDDGLGTDIYVKGFDHFYYLVYYINYELNRRGVAKPDGWWDPYSDGNKDTDDIIYSSDYMMLRAGLDACDAWSPTWATTQYMSAGASILDESTNEMRDQVDILRAECLCNCNYACTCNCNYCTCNCNYSCTCNCNYSDRRLKDNIKYL
jgi:hypothetical protein